MTQSKVSLIHSKEKLVYELAISLGVNPAAIGSIQVPDFEDPIYNTYLVLQENFRILTAMKEL